MGLSPSDFVAEVKAWATVNEDIRAVALVGSHARGAAREDSDIDLVFVCVNPAAFTRNTRWVSHFGEVDSVRNESWGRVESVRVHYRDGNEVEFGITSTAWTQYPPDPGTRAVLDRGSNVLLDRDGQLTRLIRARSVAGRH